MMPGLDGLELVSRLRDDPRTHLVPIVLLSARAGEEFALEGLSRGADDYVAKPFSSRELVARIDTHLELARMRQEMLKLKLKDEFMNIASHELMTPLTVLKLNAQRALMELEEIGSPEVLHLKRVDRAIVRIETLVGDLMTADAITRGERPLSTQRADLVAICRQAATDQVAATNRDVSLELPDQLAAVVDADAIEHVVSNLLANALKFSAANRPVVLTLSHVGHEAIIAVRDEGPGIPAGELPLLFRRFYRVPGIDVQAGSKVGFGLGLYICKSIVQRHGGRIWVESTVGRGSTFSFALPD
jgi:signal transduction histidine kinase